MSRRRLFDTRQLPSFLRFVREYGECDIDHIALSGRIRALGTVSNFDLYVFLSQKE